MLKSIVRGITALLLIVLAFYECNKVLMLKSEDGIAQIKSLYLQEENTVDVLCVGSSHIYCNINTGTLWDEYGISSYDLGAAEQPYWNSYYYIKEALKTQHPRVIVMSITLPGFRTEDYQSEYWLVHNLYGMKWNKNRIEASLASIYPDSFTRLFIPMNTMHRRYSEITKTDFIDENVSKNYKGYDYRDQIVEYDTPDIKGVTEKKAITDKQEMWYRKIIEYTQEENIPLLLISPPFAITEEEQKIYNYQFEIAEEYGLDYMDCNKLYDEIGIDYKTDIADGLHLNIWGSNKFSSYLGKYLVENYEIPDHRGDALYESWEQNSLIHRQELNMLNIKNVNNIDDYLELLKNENYVIFVNFGSDIISGDSINLLSNQLSELGINQNEIKPYYSNVLENGKTIFSSDEKMYSFFDVIDDDRLLFRRTNVETEGIVTKLNVNSDLYRFDDKYISFLVYDTVLKKQVSNIVYNPNNGILTK